MPATFAHMQIAMNAINHPELDQDLASRLRLAQAFVMLGCVSPDIPSVSINDKKWAYRMHREKTTMLVLEGCRDLGAWMSKSHEFLDEKFGWLFGYASHIVGDTIIHPIVYHLVGDWETHEQEHVECEVIQDSLLIKELTDCNVTSLELTDWLRAARSSEAILKVASFWQSMLGAIYGPTPTNPEIWLDLFIDAVDSVEGNKLVGFMARYFLPDSAESYIYQSADTFWSRKPDLCRRYFDEITLADNRRTTYMDIFRDAVANTVSLWNAMFASMVQGDKRIIAGIMPTINLDTGKTPGRDDCVRWLA